VEQFTHLNNFYDKIYILSLPSLQQRIDTVSKRLEGLHFEFFFGVDKRQTSMEELKLKGFYSTQHYLEYYKKPKEMSLGMLCCALGHVQIYQSIITNGYKKTLILEDDVVPLDKELSLFPQITAELPSDWELLYLGYEKNEANGWKQQLKKLAYMTFPNHAQLYLTRNMYKRFYPRSLSPHIEYAGFHDCTHAYSITQEGAGKLLAMQQPVAFNPDNLLAWAQCTGQIKAYISRPKLFNQLSAFTDKIPSLTGD
jgi:glycosyl transferase family 25